MKCRAYCFLLKMAVSALVLLAFCEVGAYTAEGMGPQMLLTPGCLLLAYHLYRLDEQLAALHRRAAALRVVQGERASVRVA